MTTLRRITIQQRLAILVGLIVLGLTLLSIATLSSQYQLLKDESYQKTRSLVEAAHSIIESYHKKANQWRANRRASKKKLLKQPLVQCAMKNNNYYWINDTSPSMIMHPMKPELNGKSLSNVKDPNWRCSVY